MARASAHWRHFKTARCFPYISLAAMARVHLLCLVCLLALARAANPTVKVGVSLAKCGSAAETAQPAEQSLRWWANYTNNRGGIIINGTAHDVELVMYGFRRSIFTDRLQLQRCVGHEPAPYTVQSPRNR